MAIDWSNEDFARLYKRETDDDLLLSWEAEAVWHKFLKKCDKSGFLATKRGSQGLSALLRIPLEVVDRVLPELLGDGRMREVANGYAAPNYVDANYVARSNNARQAAHRAKQRSASVNGCNPENDNSNDVSLGVTPSNAESHEVTPGNENRQSINQSINHQQSPKANDAGASKSRRAGIPEDWKPRAEELRLAGELGLDGQREAAEFHSYWLGDGRPKKNWDQTFRNRLQGQSKFRGTGQLRVIRQASPEDDTPPLFTFPKAVK